MGRVARRSRLQAAGVDLRWFALAGGHATAVAFATVDARGEAAWQLYGDGVAASVDALDGRLLEAVEATDALLFTSNTLADATAAAALTMAARERALELGRPVVFDPSVRPHRWSAESGGAREACRRCLPGAFLVKCNQAEAELITGEPDPEAAAAAMLAAGARHVVVTRGAGGAILRAPRDPRRRRGAARARPQHGRRRRRRSSASCSRGLGAAATTRPRSAPRCPLPPSGPPTPASAGAP